MMRVRTCRMYGFPGKAVEDGSRVRTAHLTLSGCEAIYGVTFARERWVVT